MHNWQSLSHVRWDCKHHIVIVPKYRKKTLYGKFRRGVGEIIRDLCRQKGVELLEGHLMPDHIHICLSVPPKFSIAFVIGFLKGKSAVRIHRELLKNKRVTGLHFWSRGYCVSTVGLTVGRRTNWKTWPWPPIGRWHAVTDNVRVKGAKGETLFLRIARVAEK